jgi:hypothetical protein
MSVYHTYYALFVNIIIKTKYNVRYSGQRAAWVEPLCLEAALRWGRELAELLSISQLLFLVEAQQCHSFLHGM